MQQADQNPQIAHNPNGIAYIDVAATAGRIIQEHLNTYTLDSSTLMVGVQAFDSAVAHQQIVHDNLRLNRARHTRKEVEECRTHDRVLWNEVFPVLKAYSLRIS